MLLYLLASDHTAMLDGGANQLTEMISPALIFEQLWALASNASSLFYFVDNVSDMLPVPLSTAAASLVCSGSCVWRPLTARAYPAAKPAANGSRGR